MISYCEAEQHILTFIKHKLSISRSLIWYMIHVQCKPVTFSLALLLSTLHFTSQRRENKHTRTMQTCHFFFSYLAYNFKYIIPQSWQNKLSNNKSTFLALVIVIILWTFWHNLNNFSFICLEMFFNYQFFQANNFQLKKKYI